MFVPQKISVTKGIIRTAMHKNYGAEWAEKSCLYASFYPDLPIILIYSMLKSVAVVLILIIQLSVVTVNI